MSTHSLFSDNELRTLLRQSDAAAFTEIYNRYWNKLYFLAQRHLKSAESPEEIVQDVFFTLWQKRETLVIQSLPLYLAAMTRYAVYRHITQQDKKHTSLKQLYDEPTGNTFSTFDNKLLLDIIENLAHQLPENCRYVFIHNKLLDQPLKQVAKDLNISTKTAEARLTQALKVIRKNMGDALSILFLS